MEFISLQRRLIRDELVCKQSHGLPGPSSVERLPRVFLRAEDNISTCNLSLGFQFWSRNNAGLLKTW